jgi:uncharacterized protein YkwD
MRLRTRLTVLSATFMALGIAGPAHAKQATVSACPSASAAPQVENVEQIERTVLCLVNRERTSRGLQRLRSSDKLAKAAASHSQDMVRRRYFSHESPGGGTMTERIRAAGWFTGARSYAFGENLAWGTGSLATPQRIVESWMDSPGHRRNILTGRYEELGVGVALGAPKADGGATYTTNFGVKD